MIRRRGSAFKTRPRPLQPGDRVQDTDLPFNPHAKNYPGANTRGTVIQVGSGGYTTRDWVLVSFDDGWTGYVPPDEIERL